MLKKIALFGAIGTILVASNIITNINIKAEYKNRLKIVERYIICLETNYGQRDYCAKKEGIPYQIIDQYAEYYGWNFGTDNSGNLVITRSAEY